jgi:hypothetical protein
MKTIEAKRLARGWVEANRRQWPGLRAAHLVGSITTMPEDAPFPGHKDVDLHLIFEPGSPMLVPAGPFAHLIEAEYAGLLIEAGLKSTEEYRSPDAVLANPEIAHHLTVDSVLHDPDGMLHALLGPVRAGYAKRRWVVARLEHERAGLAGALGRREAVRSFSGASGEANILGYTCTFAASALAVATLRSPSTGSRVMLRAREVLHEHGRLDLYARWLNAFGVDRLDWAQVERRLREGMEAFDLAVTVRRKQYPFGHKLHAHLRPYFVESCRSLLSEGFHREALHWLTPYYHASTDVILAEGPPEVRERFAARHAGFLADLGLDTEASRDRAFEQVGRVHDEMFTLAENIIASHPSVAA